MTEDILQDIADGIDNLEDSEEIQDMLKTAISQGISPLKIVEKGIRKGLVEVGKKYESGEYFLSELMFAGSLAEDSFETIGPQLKEEKDEVLGTIVLGTVNNDIHNVGKNIFSMLAKAHGFNVIDMGTDVEPEKFLESVRENEPDIVGMSCLLTTTVEEIGKVIDLFEEEGIRDEFYIIIGGNAVSDEIAEKKGADAAATQAVNGVDICKKWVNAE